MRNLYTSHGNHAIILDKTQNTTEEELRKTLQKTTQAKMADRNRHTQKKQQRYRITRK